MNQIDEASPPKVPMVSNDIKMENNAMVTTIIPTYQRPKMLERAIVSVLNQTYSNLQVCVYDNASGDETAAVVKRLMEMDSRVKYHCHEKNIGGFNNFNYGLQNIRTPFFSILSDDDIILPDFFETAFRGFNKHPEAMLSACATIHSTLEGEILGVPISTWEDGLYMPPKGALQMLEKSHPEWTGIVFRKEVIDNIGYLDREIGRAGDLYYELCVAWHFPIYVTKKVGAVFIRHPETYSAQANIGETYTSFNKIISKIKTNESIDPVTRDKSIRYFKNRLEKVAFYGGIKSILENDHIETARSINLLCGDSNISMRGSLLKMALNLCLFMPFIRKILIFVNNLRKRYKKNKRKSFGVDVYQEYLNVFEGKK